MRGLHELLVLLLSFVVVFADNCNTQPEDVGWVEDPNTGYCYKLLTDNSVYFYDASKYCTQASSSAQLASIPTPEEEQFILGYIFSLNLGSSFMGVWLGSFCGDVCWQWMDSQPFTYANWADENLSENTYLYFAMLAKYNLKWAPLGRDELLYSLCKKAGVRVITPTMPPHFITGASCPDGSVENDAECYFFSESADSWQASEGACEHWHTAASLVSVNTEEEKQFIKGNMKFDPSWVGLTRTGDNQSDTWKWQDGSIVASSDVISTNGGLCGMLHGNDNKLESHNCSDQLHYICELQIATCDPGWSLDQHTKTCYLQPTGMDKNWNQSRQYCVDLGADLASFYDYHSFDALSDLQKPGSTPFVGFKFNEEYNDWEWTDGTPNKYAMSDVKFLNTSISGECGELPIDPYYDGKIKQSKCAELEPFICEIVPTYVPSCDEAWVINGDFCYTLVVSLMDWHSAETHCISLGGHLATLPERSDWETLKDTDGYYSKTDDAWIGLSDADHPMYFTWIDGIPANFTYWHDFMPKENTDGTTNCVTQHVETGHWQTSSCKSPKSFYCKKLSSYVNRDTLTSGCQKEEISYSGDAFCYNITEQEPLNWYEAEKMCESRVSNGRLITLAVGNVYSATDALDEDTVYWIGLSFNDVSKTFQWISRANYTKESYWKYGDPDLSKGLCVVWIYNRNTYDYLWSVDDCNTKHPYICENPKAGHSPPLPPPTTTPIPGEICGEGWSEVDNKCYKMYNVTEIWIYAESTCGNGGDNSQFSLVSFTSGRQEASIRSALNISYETYWIGLQVSAEGNFFDKTGSSWMDNEAVMYINWGSGEPRNIDDCVQANDDDGSWKTTSCRKNSLSFICQKPKEILFTTVTPTVPLEERCKFKDSEWHWQRVQSENYCYYAENVTSVSAEEAERTCRGQGGFLASVEDYDENWEIERSLNAAFPAWLGLVWINLGDVRGMKWLDGTSLEYINFADGEPSFNYDEESCVVMGSSGYWMTDNCGSPHHYICKRLADPNHTIPPLTTPLSQGNCPAYWYLFEGRCFKLFSQTTDWHTARDNCKQISAVSDLASIHDFTLQAFLLLLPNSANISDRNIWIGLHQREEDDFQFLWSDESRVNYVHWDEGEPDEDNRDIQVCVMLEMSLGYWSDTPCTQTHPYICETATDPLIPTTGPPMTRYCDVPFADYADFNNDCYKLHNELTSWNNSSEICGNEGSFLVTVTSAAVESFVIYLTSSLPHTNVWLGLHTKKAENNTFYWQSGWPVTYTEWGRGGPGNVTGENMCASLNTASGHWSLEDCTTNFSFVCSHITAQDHTVPNNDLMCPNSNWLDLTGDWCYLGVSNPKLIFTDAHLMCLSLSSDLVSVHSDEEAVVVHDIVNSISADSWIGIIKTIDKGYSWTDKSGFNYENWQNDPPSSSSRCFTTTLKTGKWRGVGCHNKSAYICSMPKVMRATAVASFPVSDITKPTLLPTTTVTKITTTKPTTTTERAASSRITTKRPTTTTSKQQTTSSTHITIHAASTHQTVTNPWTALPPKTQAAGMSGGGIAGVVIGCLAIVVLLVAGVLVILKRHQIRNSETTPFYENPAYLSESTSNP